MKLYHLRIIASDRLFYDGEAFFLVIPQSEGQMGILAGHERMMVTLAEGTLYFDPVDGNRQYAVIGRGTASIVHGAVTVLTDFAEKPEEIDRLRAHEAADRARELLRQKQSIEEYYRTKAALNRAMARLRAAK